MYINNVMFNLESFCGELWSQIEISPLGDYKICCLANYAKDYGMAYDKNGKVMNVMTHSIQEAINSETHKDHRLQLKDNIKVERCRNCYDSEHSSKSTDDWDDDNLKTWGNSKRQRIISVTMKDIPEYVSCDQADEFTLPDGSVTSKVVSLGIRLGNSCNQKCIMCSPEFSTLWYDDYESIYGTDAVGFGGYKKYNIVKDRHGRNTLDFIKWWEQDIWWERLEEIAPDLRHIYMSGGEPLIVPAMQEILDRLIARDCAKNIVLRFDTNLSAVNNKVIEKFKHFRRVDFCVSMDDVGERYELIRFPGKYNTIVDNIKKLQTNGLDIHYLSCCVGLASIYSPVRVAELTEQLGIDTNFFRILEGPDWLDIRSLPRSAKQEIIDYYNSLMHHSKKKTKWYRTVVKLLEKYMDYERPDRIQKFVRTMDKFDEIRGTDWRTTLTDIYDLLNRHCPEALKT